MPLHVHAEQQHGANRTCLSLQGIHDAIDQTTKTVVAAKHAAVTAERKVEQTRERTEGYETHKSASALFEEMSGAALSTSDFSTRGKRHRGKQKKSSTGDESQNSSSTTKVSEGGEKESTSSVKPAAEETEGGVGTNKGVEEKVEGGEEEKNNGNNNGPKTGESHNDHSDEQLETKSSRTSQRDQQGRSRQDVSSADSTKNETDLKKDSEGLMEAVRSEFEKFDMTETRPKHTDAKVKSVPV